MTYLNLNSLFDMRIYVYFDNEYLEKQIFKSGFGINGGIEKEREKIMANLQKTTASKKIAFKNLRRNHNDAQDHCIC